MTTIPNAEPKWWRSIDWTRSIIRWVVASPIIITMSAGMAIITACWMMFWIPCWALRAEFTEDEVWWLEDMWVWWGEKIGPTSKY